MSSTEDANSAAGAVAGQQAYDPSLIRILSAPPRPAPSPAIPGLRKVIVPELALRSEAPSATKGHAGSFEITLDISQQVLDVTVPLDKGYSYRGDSQDVPLYRSFTEANPRGDFTPAAALALKAKQFDDGLYAAMEMASDSGLDHFPGKREFLLNLLKGLSAENDRSAAAFLVAAAQLGG